MFLFLSPFTTKAAENIRSTAFGQGLWIVSLGHGCERPLAEIWPSCVPSRRYSGSLTKNPRVAGKKFVCEKTIIAWDCEDLKDRMQYVPMWRWMLDG